MKHESGGLSSCSYEESKVNRVYVHLEMKIGDHGITLLRQQLVLQQPLMLGDRCKSGCGHRPDRQNQVYIMIISL